MSIVFVMLCGNLCRIDESDLPILQAHPWRLQRISPGSQYVIAKSQGRKTLYLHREIMQPAHGFVVDHIDGDCLNNERSNLRVVTQQQNTFNRRKVLGSSSQFKGVSLCRNSGRWKASIGYNRRCIHIGYFDDEFEAAAARDAESIRLYGEHAWLNFPGTREGSES